MLEDAPTSDTGAAQRTGQTPSLIRSAKTRAMGAGDHRRATVGPGNVFEVGFVLLLPLVLRLWPHRDRHCCMSGFQCIAAFIQPLRTVPCRRIPALPLLRQFLRQISASTTPVVWVNHSPYRP